MKITSIHINNYKVFEDYSVAFKDFNILTGLNNSGKSTIIDTIRILHSAYKSASRKNPYPVILPDDRKVYGYHIPKNSIPIITENIQNNFNEEPVTIKYRFDKKNFLFIVFSSSNQPILYFETENSIPKSAKSFREEFPLNVSVIPTLGPFEINEDLLEHDYVKSSIGSRRSPRMFRSYWFHFPEYFDEFKDLVEKTWIGMSIEKPTKESFSRDLSMLFFENRIPKEVSWAGFGFQIWLQLLTHIVISKSSEIIVVDEPEIYLHPDLQHKVLEILKNTGKQIIVATHSIEIINNVEPSEILLIDRNNRSAKRIGDFEGLQRVSYLLGSGQNIQLTKLARGKKILFVEGKDLKILNKFAKISGHEYLFNSGIITVIPIEGFSQQDRIINTSWVFGKIIGENIRIAALLDRDYRPDEEIKDYLEVLKKEVDIAHILERKEIENYLLVPNVLENAIYQRLNDRLKNNTIDKMPVININDILLNLTEKYKSDLLGQFIAFETRYRNGKNDLATVISNYNKSFEQKWKIIEFRLKIVSGKSFLSCLNEYLQNTYKISLTHTQITNCMKTSDLGNDLIVFFNELKAMIK